MTDLSPTEIRAVMAGVMLAMFLSALDQTIVATALPSIAADLGDFTLIPWVVTAYLLTSTCATPVLGKLSDIYGRRIVLNACLATFLAASVLCALADSMIWLIIARALQGAGGGGVMTLTQAVVADIIPPRERGRYAGYFATVWAAASLAGPLLGGFLTGYAGWPWIFWINLPIGLLAFVIADRALRKLPSGGGRARIAIVSVALFSASSTALLLALSWGGTTFPWSSWAVIGAFATALICGWLFFLRQRVTPEPILPPHFLRDPIVGPALGAIFLVFGAYLAVAVLAPTYFQVALGVSVSGVGVLMIPLMLATTVGAMLAGRYVTRSGNYKRPPVAALPLSILALLALAWVARDIGPVGASLLLMVVGFGVGPIFPTSIVAVQNAVAQRDLGVVTGASGFSRALGGAIATAAASALLLGLIVAWLPGEGQVANLEDLARRSLSGHEREQVAGAFAAVFAAIAATMAVGLLIYSRVADKELRRRTGDAGREPA